MTELVVGIDIGTSSTKGVLARPDGTVMASAERLHEVSLPRPGWVEHDAETIWWTDFVALSRELTARADGPIVAVCASGIGPCLLPADAAGRPLRPAILYGIDTRATAEIVELTERYGEEEILARCGSPLTSQAVGPKLLWVRRREPQVWAATEKILMASSLVVHRLTGEYILDHASASQCDPLYDLEGKRWLEDWAGEIAPGLELPRLVWPAEVVGHITAAAAETTGLPRGVPVVAGTIDAWAEAVSVGVRDPGDLMLMYGSTLFLIQVVDRSRAHAKLWSTAGFRPGTRNLAAGMATSGILTGWLRDLVGEPPFETLVAEAGAVSRGSGGLLVLPYFAGERTPLFDPDARGIICGLTLSHGRAHLYRAVLEGIAFGIRHNLETMEEAGGPSRRLVAVGGGTRGGLWTQIVSDVTGRPQELPGQTIGASYGDALLAAVGAGLLPAGADWSTITATVEPGGGADGVYDELYPHYRKLYEDTRETVHVLADLQATARRLGPSDPQLS
ncbi:MAG: FGGY-family carbohydrate kinase [Solirubrobacteraceae bacterium]